jgi:predicted transcriptional regulator
MAKDRNTMAKRQRETDKRRKQDEKREKRIRRRTDEPTENATLSNDLPRVSDGEANILAVFRKYLMTPGQMLCLSNTDAIAMQSSLDKLVSAGLLSPEDFKGGYSLTKSGFDVMKQLAAQRLGAIS